METGSDEVRFGRLLEVEARELAKQAGTTPNNSLEGLITREIALVVDHLGRVREMSRIERYRLLKMECYVGTDILRLEAKSRLQGDETLDQLNLLKKRLLEIDKERRRLNMAEEAQVKDLQLKLLSLLIRHSQVVVKNGDRETR